MPNRTGGWGKEGFGLGGWGGALPSGSVLTAQSAIAIAENVFRITFNVFPYVSTIFDANDGADVSHYSISPVAGTTGLDGNPARVVNPVSAGLSVDLVTGLTIQNSIDVVVDRPMSPYPAQYNLTVSGLADSTLSFFLSPNPTFFTLFGTFKQIQPPRLDLAAPSRDFANPQALGAIEGSTIGADSSAFNNAAGAPGPQFGTFVADATGDYAFEDGISEVRKLVYRIGMTRTGSFLHLPQDWGVGLLDAVKRLSSAAIRDQKAAQYEAQIRQIPEVATAAVTALTDPVTPTLTRFEIQVRTRTGTSFNFTVPFNTVTGAALGGFST